MKTEDIARSVAEAMDGIIVIVHMTEQKGGEVITPIRGVVPAVPAERFGSSTVVCNDGNGGLLINSCCAYKYLYEE